jgi:hypothetical protein
VHIFVLKISFGREAYVGQIDSFSVTCNKKRLYIMVSYKKTRPYNLLPPFFFFIIIDFLVYV